MSLLDNDNPPGIYRLSLKGLTADANGMYKAEDVLKRFSEAIEAYDIMVEDYEQANAA